jgi:hypothetical protein
MAAVQNPGRFDPWIGVSNILLPAPWRLKLAAAHALTIETGAFRAKSGFILLAGKTLAARFRGGPRLPSLLLLARNPTPGLGSFPGLHCFPRDLLVGGMCFGPPDRVSDQLGEVLDF